jgi:glycosyltransferase involved in cell wall biosynthesis
MPRVTVLTTLYNKGPFVEEAVRSALASTFTDLEVLVVDDGSTDDGPGRVAAITDSRVRLLRSVANAGRPAAANRGFAEARGEFIAVLDADDLMHPQRIAKQVAFLDAHTEVGAVGTALSVFGEKSEQWSWPEHDEEARGRMLFSDPVCYGTSMIRRSLLLDNGLRCNEAWLRPGMDYLFLLSLAQHTRFANIMEPLTFYRVGAQNMRHGRDPVEDRARIYAEQFRVFGIPATEEEVRLQLMLHRLFRRPPNAADVRALRAWISRLKAMNRSSGTFPVPVFEAELDRRWQDIFHPVADSSAAAAWAHLRLSHGWSAARLRYLAAAVIARWRGAGRVSGTSEPIRIHAPAVGTAVHADRTRPDPAIRYPRITLVTPSFEQAQYLEECLSSVKEQAYPDLEHIVVDGGSSDGSAGIIARQADDLAWWCSERDDGQSDAITKGAAKGSGAVFGWLNSDDLLLPGALLRVGEAFARDPSMAVLCGARILRKPDGDVVIAPEDAEHPETFFTAPHVNQQSTFYRMDVVREIGFVERRLDYVMDYELWLQVVFRHGPSAVRTIPAPLSVFRQHPASKTSLVHHRFLDEIASVLHGLCASTGQRDLMAVLEHGHVITPGLRSIPLRDPAAERARVRAMVVTFLLKWHSRIWTARDFGMMRLFRRTIELAPHDVNEEQRAALERLDAQLRVPGWWAFRVRRKLNHLLR